MEIMTFLNEKAVTCEVKSHSKEDVIKEMVNLLAKSGTIKEKDAAKISQILLEREALGSTGIGQGVAIPHGKSNAVQHLIGAFGVARHGVNFDSLDGEPVHIFFLLLAPEDSAGPHLKALARISRLLKDRHFRESLRNAKDEKHLVKIIRDEDERRH
jgi:nitrogen PTS system EIIA component